MAKGLYQGIKEGTNAFLTEYKFRPETSAEVLVNGVRQSVFDGVFGEETEQEMGVINAARHISDGIVDTPMTLVGSGITATGILGKGLLWDTAIGPVYNISTGKKSAWEGLKQSFSGFISPLSAASEIVLGTGIGVVKGVHKIGYKGVARGLVYKTSKDVLGGAKKTFWDIPKAAWQANFFADAFSK